MWAECANVLLSFVSDDNTFSYVSISIGHYVLIRSFGTKWIHTCTVPGLICDQDLHSHQHGTVNIDFDFATLQPPPSSGRSQNRKSDTRPNSTITTPQNTYFQYDHVRYAMLRRKMGRYLQKPNVGTQRLIFLPRKYVIENSSPRTTKSAQNKKHHIGRMSHQ